MKGAEKHKCWYRLRSRHWWSMHFQMKYVTDLLFMLMHLYEVTTFYAGSGKLVRGIIFPCTCMLYKYYWMWHSYSLRDYEKVIYGEIRKQPIHWRGQIGSDLMWLVILLHVSLKVLMSYAFHLMYKHYLYFTLPYGDKVSGFSRKCNQFSRC